MRCRLRFGVTGRIKPDVPFPITVRGITYEFDTTESGIITHIIVTFLIDKEHWPTVIPSHTPGVKYHINIPAPPQFFFIEAELRTLEGLLSLYGLHSIDIQHPLREWLPDSEDETEELKKTGLLSFKAELKPPDDSQIVPLEFDLIVKSILATENAFEIEIPLSFFRKGRIDMYEMRYIEAIYDFYFLFETLFGEGQTKNYNVKKCLKNSELFLRCIKEVIDNPGPKITQIPLLRQGFEKKYKSKKIEKIVDDIVDLRGFLHHHTLKRRGIWHPDRHKDYELDALIIEKIAFNVAFEISAKYVFPDEK